MFRPLVLLLAAVPLLSWSAVRAADDDPKEIVQKAIKAHGGEEYLTKYKAGQGRNKGKINIPGVGEIDFTQETAFMIPGKGKEDIELNIGGMAVRVVTLIDGDKVTIKVNGKVMETPAAVKDTLKNLGYIMKVGRLAPLLKDKGYELSLVGEDKVEGKPAIGIRVTMKDQKDLNLYFDKKTNLLAKIEYRGTDPNGKEVTEERIIAEYAKGKDGNPVPKKVIVKHDGKTFLDAEVLEFTYLEKLDDSVFKE